MENSNLSAYVQFDSSGNVDVEATMGKLREAVTAYATLQKTDLESVRGAVHAVFDENLGAAINLPAVQTLASQKLNPTPKTLQTVCDRIASYVRNNKAEFEITKGRGGGVRRIKDKPAEASPAAAE